jgi:O-antigen/teichoic acid export membrane protein
VIIKKYFNNIIFLIVFQKITQIINGLIVIILVNNFFDLSQQGIFYLMSSLLASYVLFDLSLSTFLVQKASMIKSNSLNLLNTFKKFIFQVYFISGLLILLLIPFGFFYFNLKIKFENESYWIMIVIILALSQPFIAYLNLLEAKKIKLTYKLRIFINILNIILSTFFFYIEEGFFALVSFFLANILIVLPIFIRFEENFFKKKIFQFKKKIWSKFLLEQKNTFIYSLSFFIFFYYPTLFSFLLFDETVSGKIGISLVVCNVIFALSYSHVTSVIPFFTKLIKFNNILQGRKIFFRNIKMSLLISLVLNFFLILMIKIFNPFFIFNRFLQLDSFIFLIISTFFLYLINNLNIFCRVFKQEFFHKELSCIVLLMVSLTYLISFEDYFQFLFYYTFFVIVSFLYLVFKILWNRYSFQ